LGRFCVRIRIYVNRMGIISQELGWMVGPPSLAAKTRRSFEFSPLYRFIFPIYLLQNTIIGIYPSNWYVFWHNLIVMSNTARRGRINARCAERRDCVWPMCHINPNDPMKFPYNESITPCKPVLRDLFYRLFQMTDTEKSDTNRRLSLNYRPTIKSKKT